MWIDYSSLHFILRLWEDSNLFSLRINLARGNKGTNSMVVTFSVGGNFHRGWTEGEKEEERRRGGGGGA